MRNVHLCAATSQAASLPDEELHPHSAENLEQPDGHGWAGLKNGALLQRAAISDLRPLVSQIVDAVQKSESGRLLAVGA